MNKTLGYILIAVGFVIFLLSFDAVNNIVHIPIPVGLTANIVMIIGVVVLGVGAFIVSKGSPEQMSEVPIYHGKEVVGYRRLKK